MSSSCKQNKCPFYEVLPPNTPSYRGLYGSSIGTLFVVPTQEQGLVSHLITNCHEIYIFFLPSVCNVG